MLDFDNVRFASAAVKAGGTQSVLDFDNVRSASAVVNIFNSWISAPAFGLALADQGFALGIQMATG